MFKSGAQRTAVVLSEQERHGLRTPMRPQKVGGGMANMLSQRFGMPAGTTSMRKPWGRGQNKAFSRDKPRGAGVQARPFGNEQQTKPFGAHGGNDSRTGDVFGSEPKGDNFGFGGF